jgi:hypothetical protein
MTHIRTAGLFLALFFLLFLPACSKTGDQEFISDKAGLLDEQARQNIIVYHRALLKDFNIHLKAVILTQPSSDINRDAAELFGSLGNKTGRARGLLFLIDPIGKQVRIEVGYDLEGIFPDGFVSYIEREQMIPFFQQAKVGEGILATEELFIARAQRSAAGEPYDPNVELGRLSHLSGGGGARTRVDIGHGPIVKTAVNDSNAYLPQHTPIDSLTVYMRLLRNKIKDPDLALYTPETRKFLSRWVVTDAQQENELSRLERASIDRVLIAGNKAVIRFPSGQRTMPPYFLEKNGSGWAFDFAAMNNLIRMNHKNMWHFVSRDHPYMFGFADWRFDLNGYPIPER